MKSQYGLKILLRIIFEFDKEFTGLFFGADLLYLFLKKLMVERLIV